MGACKELWMAEMEKHMEAYLACHPDADESDAHEAVVERNWREGDSNADEEAAAKEEYLADQREDDLMRERWEAERNNDQ